MRMHTDDPHGHLNKLEKLKVVMIQFLQEFRDPLGRDNDEWCEHKKIL